MIYRLLGDVAKWHDKDGKYHYDKERETRWLKLPGTIARRTLHDPEGSRNYRKPATIPEMGVCLEVISHMAIDRFGDVYPCVRFNPDKHILLGNANDTPLIDIWNGEVRQKLLKEHREGNRNGNELCANCHFWGIPTSS